MKVGALLVILASCLLGLPSDADSPLPTTKSAAPSAAPTTASIATSTLFLPVVDAQGLQFSRLSTAQGLSQTRVAQIVQDDRGFMWFGTQYGLNRFDGYEFKVFVHEPGQTNSLSGAWVYSLFKDRKGILWIGCNQVLNRFDPSTEAFTHYHIDQDDLHGTGGTVVHISQDTDGILWLATGSGLTSLNPSSGDIKHYRHSPNDLSTLSTNDVNWTGQDNSGHLWVGTRNGLEQLDRQTGHVTFRIPMADAVQVAFYEDRSGAFWVYQATGSGLALYNPSTNAVTRYSFYGRAPPDDQLTGVMGMVEDDQGRLWLGSPGIGLLEYDRINRRFLHYRNHPPDPESIAEDKVIALFKDREGNIWTGLHSHGPNHFLQRNLQFESFKHDAENSNSLTTDFVNAIYEDADGILWIGNDEGLHEIDHQGSLRRLRSLPLGSRPMVITISGDSSGSIWFGTFNQGVSRYDPHSGRITTYRHDPAVPNSLSNDEVHKIFVDHKDRLWIATDDGLDLFDYQTQTFHVYKVDPNNRLSQSYVAIDEAKDGTLWLGSAHSGLHHFDPATGQFTVIKSQSGISTVLGDDTVPSVHVSPRGDVWIGTQNGLSRLDPLQGRFFTFDRRDGLPANSISCILEDGRGDLWLSTNKGLSHFDPTRNTFNNYSTVDGLPGEDLTGWSTCFRSKRGEMFFAGFAGAVGFYPEVLQEVHSTVATVLTDIEVSGRAVAIGSHAPMTRSIAYADGITLTHRENTFAIAFSGMTFANAESTRYRYQLAGLDRIWYESDSRVRRAAYTSLAPGYYVLYVQSAASRGAWSEPGATFTIRILPPWWATWWSRALYGILAIIAFGYLYRLRLLKVNEQWRIRMEARISERTRIARDLHDTLLQGLLSASLQLEVAREELAPGSTAIPRIERVFRQLRQMIDESRQTVRGLRLPQTPQEALDEAIKSLLTEMGRSNSVSFQMHVNGERKVLKPAVRTEFYWICKEALSNAARHAQASIVHTTLDFSANRFLMTIEDNGVGMPAELIASGRTNHWGLKGIDERAARVGATVQIHSVMNGGTAVMVTIPSRDAYLTGSSPLN